jgi:hypothetical protein
MGEDVGGVLRMLEGREIEEWPTFWIEMVLRMMWMRSREAVKLWMDPLDDNLDHLKRAEKAAQNSQRYCRNCLLRGRGGRIDQV